MFINHEISQQSPGKSLSFMEFIIGNCIGIGSPRTNSIISFKINSFWILIEITGVGKDLSEFEFPGRGPVHLLIEDIAHKCLVFPVAVTLVMRIGNTIIDVPLCTVNLAKNFPETIWACRCRKHAVNRFWSSVHGKNIHNSTRCTGPIHWSWKTFHHFNTFYCCPVNIVQIGAKSTRIIHRHSVNDNTDTPKPAFSKHSLTADIKMNSLTVGTIINSDPGYQSENFISLGCFIQCIQLVSGNNRDGSRNFNKRNFCSYCRDNYFIQVFNIKTIPFFGKSDRFVLSR